jgi:hypothetical protein
MRAAILMSLMVCVAGIGVAAAQPNPAPSPVPDTSCRPDTRETAPAPPTVGRGSPRDTTAKAPELSDRLAESKGVICPPQGIDPEIQLTPPPGGDIRVIPAPGAPGGNPNLQPK